MTVQYHLIVGLIEFLIGLGGWLLVHRKGSRSLAKTLFFVLMGMAVYHLIIAVAIATFGTPE